MTTEITITAEQLRIILNTLDTQRESEMEYSESGNKPMQYFCEGQASGIEFVLNALGISY